MAHVHGPEPVSVYSADDCHEELSNKYTEYIEVHLETLRKKCDHFKACIEKLLKGESVLHILKGEDISLNKTCGLVYKNGSEGFSTLSGKCTIEERNDIRDDIEHHLRDQMAVDEWKSVKKCLGNSYGDCERTTFVDEICGLAYDHKFLCNNYNTHKTVETFFNDQIQHLECTCRSLSESADSPAKGKLPIVIGAAVGGLLLLIILLVGCFLCYRRRRTQKKKKKRSPNVIYLPAPNADNCPVYQEVYNDSQYQGYRPTPSTTPPTLPMRYTPHPSAASNLSQAGGEESAYLEPVEVGPRHRPRMPLPGIPKSNPGYDAPPRYSQTEESILTVREDENGYFQPLPSPTEEDKGYNTLGKSENNSSSPPAGYESVDGTRPRLSSIPSEDAPEAPVGPPLGPVPAKRTKKDDRQVESHYFELEKLEDNKTTSS